MEHHRQFAFDDGDEDDEFMNFYRKYRPGSLRSSLHGSGSQASSSSVMSQASDVAANSTTSSSKNSVGKSLFPLRRQWFQAKRKLLPKSRSAEEEPTAGIPRIPYSCNNSNSSHAGSLNANGHCGGAGNTSPLQGLAGMLSDKMTVSTSSGGSGHGADDSQSRDSGNSSGGSPDLRGLRRRLRGAPPPPPNSNSNSTIQQQQQHYGYEPREWYRLPPPPARSLPYRNNPDDRHSIYSYATAYDHAGPGADESMYGGARGGWAAAPSEVYGYAHSTSAASRYYDTSDEPLPSSARTWHPDMGARPADFAPSPHRYTKRKVDCIRGEMTFGGQSPLAKRPYTPAMSEPSDSSLSSSNHSPAAAAAPAPPQPASKADLLRLYCARLCLLVKALLMLFSCCLLVFACFFLWRSSRCQSDRQAGFDLPALAAALHANVFGQDLARAEILSALRQFSSGSEPVRVLVLLGWLGGGKTYVASLLRDHFPLPGNVHHFSVPLHFARDSDHFHFLDDLSLLIGRSCGHSLVVFDDVDAAGSPRTLEQIERFVLNLSNAQLSSRSNGTLVVLTTNAGGAAINQRVLEAMRDGVAGDASRPPRDQLTLDDVLGEVGDDVGVPGRSAALARHGTPVSLVPFLPLTRDHVRQCIRKEIGRQGFPTLPDDVNRLLAEMAFFSQDYPVLSKTGCKQVAGKVDLYLGGQDPYLHG